MYIALPMRSAQGQERSAETVCWTCCVALITNWQVFSRFCGADLAGSLQVHDQPVMPAANARLQRPWQLLNDCNVG
jgi:hypothetical protein